MKTQAPTRRLSEVVSFRGGGTPSTERADYWRGDIPWVSPKDMKFDLITDAEDKISPAAIAESATNLIPAGSCLIVVRSGILARTVPVGLTGRDVAVNQDIKALTPGAALDPKYLFYFLRSAEPRLLGKVTRGATVHRLSTDDLRELAIPVPPLAQQKVIVAMLDEAFEGIAKVTAYAERNLANARELFASCLDSAISDDCGAPISIADLVERGILDRPIDGNHGDTHPKKADFVDAGVPFIMASDLFDGRVDQIGCTFISEKLAASLRKGFARDGDVLISHKGTIGRVAVLETEHPFVMLTPQVTYYRTLQPETLAHQYLYFALQERRFQREMAHVAGAGSTRAYIGILRQLELSIRVPSIDEQYRIANFSGYVDFFVLQDLVADDRSTVNFFMTFEDFNSPSTPKDRDAYEDYRRRSIGFVEARNRRIERSAAQRT